jgi:hypothetical protein
MTAPEALKHQWLDPKPQKKSLLMSSKGLNMLKLSTESASDPSPSTQRKKLQVMAQSVYKRNTGGLNSSQITEKDVMDSWETNATESYKRLTHIPSHLVSKSEEEQEKEVETTTSNSGYGGYGVEISPLKSSKPKVDFDSSFFFFLTQKSFRL